MIGVLHLSVAAALAAAAPGPLGPQRSATEILAEARQAMGGAAWDRVDSIRTTYTFEVRGAAGRSEELEDVRHGRFVSREAEAGRKDESGFDGVSVWTLGQGGVEYTLGDLDSTLWAPNEAFRVGRGWWAPDRFPATIAVDPEQTEGGRTFDVLSITPAGGRPFTLWIDRQTHLPDRYVERTAESTTTVSYSDYRSVEGVLLPATEKLGDVTYHATSTILNGPFNESEFSVGASNRAIPRFDHPTTVKVRFDRGRVLVPVFINGQGPFECEFDSGGGFVLSPGAAARLKLRSMGQSRAFGGGEGSVMSDRGTVDSLSVGGVDLGSQRYHTLDLGKDNPERVLVGEILLQRAVVRIDFDASTMTLTPFEQFSYRGTGAIVPFHFQDNQPEVLGAVDGIAARMTVDTGDNGSLLLIAPFARRYDLAARYHARIPYHGTSVTSTHGLYARAGTVTINDADGRPAIEVHRPVTRISQQEGGFDADRYVSANVGYGILHQFNLTIDYSRRQLIFERNHQYGGEDVFDRSGMGLTRTPTTFKVLAVYPGGPAMLAGVKEGDEILRINGSDPATITSAELGRLLKGPVGSTLNLVVRPAGATERAVTIKLAEQL